MPQDTRRSEQFQKTFLLLLALGISLIFFFVVKSFLMAMLLAAILSGMAQPLFNLLVRLSRGRKGLASFITVFVTLVLIIVPLSGFIGLLAGEAIEISNKVRPAFQELINEPNRVDDLLRRLPFYDQLEPYQDQILIKVGETASIVGTFLVNAMAKTTRGTALFFLQLFIMLYAMFFFLLDGRAVLDKILYYMPLSPQDEELMVEKFLSVTRATIKGSLIIGVLQGGLAGLAFWVAGIEGAILWGTIMVVLSIIPGVGTALVWVPAVIYLFASGQTGTAIGLTIWCAGLVGTIDNFLRPRLVGRDTKMPDLLILVSTLGGLVLFGVLGFIIGPIIAALFIAIWEIYGEAFKDWLPPVISD